MTPFKIGQSQGQVVVQKAAPSWGGVLGRRGRYLPTELKQFAINARRAPERVGSAHPADQVADFGIRLGSSGTA
jgi:hypothetical protein